MIVSHAHRFIFIKTRKTAGTSAEIGLSRFCGPDDIITPITPEDEQYRAQLGCRGSQNTEIPLHKYKLRDWGRLAVRSRKARFFNHMPASAVRHYLPGDVWNSYFKFCFERNCFDKAISFYFWLGGPDKFGSFSSFVRSDYLANCRNYHLYTRRGELAVDRVFQYHEIERFPAEITGLLNLPETFAFPPRRAKGQYRTDKRHYSTMINASDRKVIEEVFADEIRAFGYVFEDDNPL